MDFKKILFKTSEIDVEKSLPDGIIFCNKEGKIIWINDKAAELFETSKMHMLTSNIADFIENAKNAIENAILSSKTIIVKILAKELYFEMTGNEIEEGYILDFRSSNSLTKINEDVINRETSPDKNLFLLKLANDLKSPLQSIVGFSQALTDGLGGEISEQQDKYIKIIKKNSSELMYFVNKLLELSQTESDLKTPVLKVFDIVNLINSIARFNEQLNKGKDLRWSVKIEEEVKNTIISDEEIVKNIVQNILEVILRAIDMGEVEIKLSLPDEEFVKSKNLFGSNFLMISISSNSFLLSENDLECIFNPYKIVDSSNRKNLLRAMILACVKNSVQSLNGAVWVESQILKNTSFNIILPQSKNQEVSSNE